MKKLYLFTILFQAIFFNSFAQIVFEKGYFIGQNTKKVDCYIKNVDWKNNPSKIEYKLDSLSNDFQYASIENIIEFSIANHTKYVRHSVQIDRSGTLKNNIFTERNPVFTKESLFLRVLVEGEAASLYYYESGELKRFFYQLKDSTAKQLVFKYYRLFYGGTETIATNDQFKQQLWAETNCQNKKMLYFSNLSYKTNNLVNHFVEYNKCKNSDYIDYSTNRKKGTFRLKVILLGSMTKITLNDYSDNRYSTTLNSNQYFQLGTDLEYIVPINKGKWSIFLEPTYQRYKKEKNISQAYKSSLDIAVRYSSIEMPIGLRHYFFFKNPKTAIFLDAAGVFNWGSGFVEYTSKPEFAQPYKIKSDINTMGLLSFAAGAGIIHHRLSGELRFYSQRELLGNYFGKSAKYQKISLVIGYRIF